jgi:hypothetical protein
MRPTKLATIIILSFLYTLFSTNAFAGKEKSDLLIQKIKGRVKTVTELEYTPLKDSLKSKSVGKYNDSGYLVEYITYGPSGNLLSKSICSYDDSGKFIGESRYKSDGSLMVKTTRKYDDKGNIAEESSFDASGTLFLKVVNRFDYQGVNRKVKDSYNEFGILFLKANYKFDENGNETEIKEFDSHHGLKFAITFDYDSYDSKGNWLHRTTSKNNEPASFTERQLEYYP